MSENGPYILEDNKVPPHRHEHEDSESPSRPLGRQLRGISVSYLFTPNTSPSTLIAY